MRNRFCRQFDLNSSRLGRYDLLSVVQTEAVPMTQQQGGKSLGCFLKLLAHNLILLLQHHESVLSVYDGKRKSCCSGNSLFLSGATRGLF